MAVQSGLGDWIKGIGNVVNTANAAVRFAKSIGLGNSGSNSIGYSTGDPVNALTYDWMQQANAFNANEAQKNRDWQEYMSNTAYQRAMADMEKAGLNPILAANNGGASTPGGDSASAVFTGAQGGSGGFGGSITSAKGLASQFIAKAGETASKFFDYLVQGQGLKVKQAEKYVGNLYGYMLYAPSGKTSNSATAVMRGGSRNGSNWTNSKSHNLTWHK